MKAIAKRSQNVIWKTTVDNQRGSHNRIRKVSMNKFYEIVADAKEAFFKIGMALSDSFE